MFDELKKYFTDRISTDDNAFEIISQHFKFITAKRDEMLFMQGEVYKNDHFVNNGCLRLFTINKNGVGGTRYFAFEGAFGTALQSLIEQRPDFEFVQTSKKSELLFSAVGLPSPN